MDHVQLLALLKAGGLAEALNSTDFAGTVFAPTDLVR